MCGQAAKGSFNMPQCVSWCPTRLSNLGYHASRVRQVQCARITEKTSHFRLKPEMVEGAQGSPAMSPTILKKLTEALLTWGTLSDKFTTRQHHGVIDHGLHGKIGSRGRCEAYSLGDGRRVKAIIRHRRLPNAMG